MHCGTRGVADAASAGSPHARREIEISARGRSAARARSFSEGSLTTDALGAGLVFVAPVYYSTHALPRALQLAAYVLPTTYAADGVRTLLGGGTAVNRELLALSVMTVVTLGVGFRVMRWQEE